MADPPPIRRSADPPPIPPTTRASPPPVAPSVIKTEVTGAVNTDELPEDTRNLEAPDAGELVEHMLDLVASEGAALLTGDDADGRLADLNIRTALASWDALHQPDEAVRFLELAERHPLAPRMRLSAALAAGSPDALETAQKFVEDRASAALETTDRGASAALDLTERGNGEPGFNDTARGTTEPRGPMETALAIELAEAWLFRHGRAADAATIADRVLAGSLPETWRAHVVELASLAHAAAGHWARVVELRREAVGTSSSPEEVAATAALLLDRGSDPTTALAACWTLLELFPGVEALPTGSAVGWLRVFDVALDAATALGDERRFELLDKRAELVAALPGGALEATCTRFAVAAELDRHGDHGDAAAAWQELAADPASQLPGAARRIANLAATWAAAAAGDREHALAAHRALADSECSEVAATHAWRALELAAALDLPNLMELASAIVDVVGGPVAERWLDLLEIRSPTAAMMTRFEVRGGLSVRWAATVAERRGELGAAIKLWWRATVEPNELGTAHDHLARLHRTATSLAPSEPLATAGGDEDRLAEVYTAWAASERDPRNASALHCARGIVDLARGDFVEAEESLLHAADLDPKDPFCRAALAAVYRAGRRYDQLAGVLAQLGESLQSRDARAIAMREHAELLDEYLGDPAGARAALEKMIGERPEDTDAMLALARLCDRDQLWPRAIELRARAAEIVPADKRPDVWMDIARVEEARGEIDAALAALDKVAETPSHRSDAMRAKTRMLRAANLLDRALASVRAELATEPPLARRMELQAEVAQLLTQLGIEPENVVAAYLDVLSIEPDQTEALAGIEAPARQLGLWDELARAFRGAPATPRNLDVLAEALEKIAEWAELAEVRRRQLENAATPADKAQRAADLAGLYERELGDIDAAVRMLVLAQTTQPDEARQRDLLRLLRETGRSAEIVSVLERELPQIRPSAIDRQLEVLLELGELRATKLDRGPEAIQAYEAVLERRSDHGEALAALEKLYEQHGRDRELARLLEARAEGTTETGPRAALFSRVAQLRATRGDVEGALAAYTAAFRADPTNRDVFTSMERVCYKAERWAAAMQLYELAIEHVEGGQGRAYRLGDLYARRGNVQLNFLGQIDAAIASYGRVIEVDSNPANAVKILEDLCAQRGDWQPLISAWEQRAETQRDPARRTDALRAAARLAAEHGKDARQSMRLNRKLLTINPADAGAQETLERYFEDAQDPSGLVDVLKMRLEHAKNTLESVDILRRIARVSEEGARDVETATEHYQKILELQPDNRDALEALGRIYESTEQWAEFIDITRKQIKVTTDRNTKALLYFRCGSVMEAKFGREQDAIRYYDAAIKTAPSCLPAVHGLRDLYRRREEWPRVIETLELEVKLWQDDKERAGVFAQIGRIYENQLGDAEQAMHFYESALAVDPECLPANQALFDHFFSQGAWDKAQPIASALAQKAMREGDPATRSDFYRKRGVVSRATGDLRAAAESFIVALEIKPTNAAALDDLCALARDQPDVWDFDATYRELEKVYKKRDDAQPLMARVNVGRAAMLERAGDLDQAADLYHDAVELAPGDLTILSALVDFHADMRHWREAVTAIDRFCNTNSASAADRLSARMRQANIIADGEMDPIRAIASLREIIKTDPSHQDAYYLLAQQCFLAGRHGEARAAIDRVIELATAPGQPLTAEALARYYYYKGRILDVAGDARAAAPQYRRAIDYDPGYAPPALVLARRAADAGDQRQAESLLLDAAHAAMEQGGPRAAVPLQRGLARILLASGDRPAAIDAYRGILNVEPDGASDRVALAEIYAVDDPQRAIGELRKVLDRDIHHAPAYRLLASFYNRTGDTERANRVLTALDLLGFAEEADRATMQRLRAVRVMAPLVRELDDDNRTHYLITPAAQSPLGEVFDALAEELTDMVPTPGLGVDLQPAQSIGDPRVLQIAAEVGRLFQTDAEIFVGDKVPGLAAVTAFPRRLLVIDRSLLAENDLAMRFLFGYAFEAIRGNYAALLQLGARQRRELGQLMRTLLQPESEITGPAADLIDRAIPRAIKVIERHAGAKDIDPGTWMDGMLACAKRAGLVACDDFTAAIWMVARLSGESLASHDATVALGAVLGGSDLVRFYLSDNYQHLRDLLTVG